MLDEDQLLRWMHLAHHLYNEHLRDPEAGLGALASLTTLPVYRAEGPSGQAAGRYRSSLQLTNGADADSVLQGRSASDQVRVLALAAAGATPTDPTLAGVWLRQGEDIAGSVDVADPAHRALAANANNIATTLESAAERSAAGRALMIGAAEIARREWAIAGGWLETERAEYRLAMTWLAAGDPARARGHAEACRAIVAANAGPPLERFFAVEAVARVARAAADDAGWSAAAAEAGDAFQELSADDQHACRESLDRLGAPPSEDAGAAKAV